MALPPFPSEPASTVYFVKLTVLNAAKKEVSSNFYWLPAKLSTIAWDKVKDRLAPIATFEDLTALQQTSPRSFERNGKDERSRSSPGHDSQPNQKLGFQVTSASAERTRKRKFCPSCGRTITSR